MPSFEPVDYDPWAPNPQAVAAAAPAMAPPSPTFDQLGRNAGAQAQNLSWPSAPGQPARVTVNPLQSDFPAYSPTIGTGPETTGTPSAGNRDYAGEITKSFSPETFGERTSGLPPALPAPNIQPFGPAAPLAAPAKMQAELANPYVMDRLIAMTRAEVGNLGPEGGQKFLETIRNRAMAEGKPIAQILADRKYFPAVTFRAAAAPVSEREREVYGPLVEQMIAGSNSANYATGNASYDPVKRRWVGFQGGPQTTTTGRGYGTELYGIEKPHLDWAKGAGYEGGQAAPYISENEAAFSNAAARTARGVRPEGGRQPGLATHFMETFFPTAVQLQAANQIARPQLLKRMGEEVIGRPRAAIESAGSLQRGGSYDPGPILATTLGAFSPRVPGLIAGGGAGQAGVFGGRLAATADQPKLRQAESLHAQGLPMEQIRQQTGWHLGPDNQWRFEINDQNARVRTGKGPLEQQLEHPDLYAAYPHLRDVEANITEGGRPKGSGGTSYDPVLGSRISAEAPSEGQRKRIALHEGQHLVQDYEGFSPGSNPDTVGGPVYTAINDELSRLAKIMDKGGEPAKAAAARYHQLMSQRANFDPYDLYHRQAGEVEARNVMERANWTAEERAMVDPRYTEDVPRDRQITQQPYKGKTAPRRAYEPEAGAYHSLEDTFAGTGSGERTGKSGRDAGVAEASRAATDAAGSARPLIGLPTKALTIGPDSYYVPGPNSAIHTAAEEYMRSKGLKYEPPQTYAKVDIQRAERIADEFQRMMHAPDDPKVAASYDAMIKETVDQFLQLEKMGIKFEPIPPGMPDPYAASPRLANKDFRDNKHLWYFPTDTGFGSSAADVANNPLLRMTDVVINGKPLPANDVFRIVHDVFGHFKEGVGFRAEGEENAWRSHSAMYSDLARPAMTSETRGQNSWVNYGPNGPQNRTASAADTVYADQKTGLLPDWVMNEGRNDFKPVEHDPFGFEDHPGYISTRLPTAKGAKENPFSTRLTIDVDAMKQQPKLYQHNVSLVRSYPIMTSQEARLPVDQAAKTFMERVTDNVLWLHDQVPPEIAARSKLWYDGANRIAHHRATEHGLTAPQVSGVYAAMSPQKDWFQNVSLGDRVMDTYFNHPDFKMTKKDMYGLPAEMQADKFKALRAAIEGRTYKEIDPVANPLARAFWTRAHDQLTRQPSFHIVSPEGNYGSFVLTDAGIPAKIQWGSGKEITKALNTIESGGNIDTISQLMGMRHKVRSFYNNILHPNAPHGDVTIDTHAVAGGLLQPLGGSAREVAQNFGNYPGKDIPAAGGSALSGVRGVYPLYADAYRAAAAQRGLLPRQMQSITWEAARGLFPDVSKGVENIERVKSFWNSYRKGNMTLQDVRDAITENQGGIKPPPWWTE